MTDYLEQLLDNTAALLERVRKLENSQPVSEQEHGSPPAFGTEGTEHRRRAEPEDGPGRERYAAPEDGAEGKTFPEEGVPASPRPRQEREIEGASPQRESSPLLEQLERLERAQAALEGGGAAAGGRPAPAGAAGTGYPLSLAGPGRRTALVMPEDLPGWSGEQRELPGTETASGGALDWTEQADRIFRRDSRRYDGGFYLY